MTINPVRFPPPVVDLTTRRPDQAITAATPGNTVPPAPTASETPATLEEQAASAIAAPPSVLVPATTERAAPSFEGAKIEGATIEMTDPRSRLLARQVPTEEWVRALKRLREAKGLFVDRKG
jgi:hypothetical protein